MLWKDLIWGTAGAQGFRACCYHDCMLVFVKVYTRNDWRTGGQRDTPMWVLLLWRQQAPQSVPNTPPRSVSMA